MAASVHLICGATGAGKTTYAKKLASDIGAVRFSIDESMITLFDADRPEGADFDWYMNRINRIETDLWQTTLQIAGQNVDVILDLGFSLKAHRTAFRNRAGAAGCSTCLHYLDISTDERWKRVEERNQHKGDTYALEVTRPMFDFVDAMFETPENTEMTLFDRSFCLKP